MSRSDVIQAALERGDLLASTVENLEVWVTGDFLPEWGQTAIGELVENEEWRELNDRFFRHLAFGTGGMRGRTIGSVVAPTERGAAGPGETPAHPAVGTNTLNDFNIVRATVGLFRYTQRYLREEQGVLEAPKLVIAHDVRHFSRHFCELAASAWVRLGGQSFIFAGPRSTPQLSFTVRHLRAHAGVVITASHNPPHDNGFKAYFGDGAQVVSPHAEGIVAEVKAVDLNLLPSLLEKDLRLVAVLGKAADAAYFEALEENVLDAELLARQRPRVVFTPIHGTGGVASVPVMEKLGVEVIPVPEQWEMNPSFPTVKSPNPENAEALRRAILKAEETGADVVLATDPDADRMGVAVRNRAGQMELLTGNQIGALLVEYRTRMLKEGGILPEEGTERAALIKTFVTSPLQAAVARGHGLKVIDTLTGFKFIGEKLRDYEETMRAQLREAEGLALDYDRCAPWTRAELLLEYSTYVVFGGEESYGYLASDRVRDKDANGAVLMFSELAAWLQANEMTAGEFLDSLYLEHGYFLEAQVNLFYEGAEGAARIGRILEGYRNDPPRELAGVAVTAFRDFGRETIRDADGKVIPAQDFYFLELAGGTSYAVRGSGTEPKIKFYLFAREAVGEGEDMAEVKARTQARLEAMGRAIEAEARARAGE